MNKKVASIATCDPITHPLKSQEKAKHIDLFVGNKTVEHYPGISCTKRNKRHREGAFYIELAPAGLTIAHSRNSVVNIVIVYPAS